MRLFEAVKERVTTRQAAERYGIKVRRNGMCSCPFHKDRHPSMKVDDRFYCFSCGSTGDVIDFAGMLFHLEPVEAARKLAEDFGIAYEYQDKPYGQINTSTDRKKSAVRKIKKTEEEIFNEKRTKAFRAYLDYRSDLNNQKERYAPKGMQDDWTKEFVQILSTIVEVEYYLNILLYGSKRDQEDLIQEKEGEVKELARRYGLS